METFIKIMIAFVIICAIITAYYQATNPEKYCSIARKYSTVQELPAYCLKNEVYPQNRVIFNNLPTE